MSPWSVLGELSGACERLLTTCNDFWVVAGLTDGSFEEGERNDEFGEAVDSYESAGIQEPLLASLRSGINGNLAAFLSATPGVLSVHRNQGRGHDLILSAVEADPAAFVEIKLVHDCTYLKYFAAVSRDMEKLRATRRSGFAGGLYLAVFYLQLPSYRYRRGLGRRATVRCGIVEQHEELRRHMTQDPVWPAPAGPEIHRLRRPSATLCAAIRRRHDETAFGATKQPFEIDPQLVDAGVGSCVWEVPAL